MEEIGNWRAAMKEYSRCQSQGIPFVCPDGGWGIGTFLFEEERMQSHDDELEEAYWKVVAMCLAGGFLAGVAFVLVCGWLAGCC
jgi:hypothetical protein